MPVPAGMTSPILSSRAVHILDATIWSQLLKSSAVTLQQDISDKEGSMEAFNLRFCAPKKNLSHSGGQMHDRDLVVASPFGESIECDVFSRRDDQAGAQEKRCEYVSLYWIVCNAAQHRKSLLIGKIETL
ncbi:hypothetical protein AC579_10344 [Pseudocercospora musae]|uniref:Uncharacterized protein n=1 Tax=Pseudocercospora musae TaxID=113226 RepID=A0A139ICP3_9PEZI|nr:hypothetical protein AC579_10344 [Pseudocercospora musae]